jgi:glucosyl-dolichyl phosphate glucuronosyltransferase
LVLFLFDMEKFCSIIICTRNRAPFLEKTLSAFQKVKVPLGWRVEMIVADNGSVDHTAKVIETASHSTIVFVYVREPHPGKSRAQNTAIAAARGEVLLFTDDDVEPAENWIEEMARPLFEMRCDAVVSRILLGKELQRPWFTHMHEIWLAVNREPAAKSPLLIGASMGIRRSVFDKIGNFDEELGPGASGFGEETLLWRQMLEAGLEILPIRDTHVTHHPETSRLLRANWLTTATRFGEGGAYIMHHWEHAAVALPALQALALRVKLYLRRLSQGSSSLDEEGCPAWEMSYLVRIAMLERFMIERRKPRKYERRGLHKIA